MESTAYSSADEDIHHHTGRPLRGSREMNRLRSVEGKPRSGGQRRLLPTHSGGRCVFVCVCVYANTCICVLLIFVYSRFRPRLLMQSSLEDIPRSHDLHSGSHDLHSGSHDRHSGSHDLHSGSHDLHSGSHDLHSGLHDSYMAREVAGSRTEKRSLPFLPDVFNPMCKYWYMYKPSFQESSYTFPKSSKDRPMKLQDR